MNDDLNEDWIKTLSWDLPEDLDGFLDYLGVSNSTLDEKRAALGKFENLPAVAAMPDRLRDQITALLSQ